MKKIMIFMLFFILLSTTACSIDSSTKSNTLINTNIDTSTLIGSSYKDIENLLGIPYSRTYYIDNDKLNDTLSDKLTMEDLIESINITTSYKIKSKEKPFLHIYFKNGVAVNAMYGNYTLSSSKNFINSEDVLNTDYKVDVFSNKGYICESDFVISYASKEFEGKTITDFNKSFEVSSSNVIASTINGNHRLYFYPLVPHKQHPDKNHSYPNYNSNSNAKLDTVNPVNNNISNINRTDNKYLKNYAESSVVIYTKNDVIQSISIEGKDFVYGILNKTFNK